MSLGGTAWSLMAPPQGPGNKLSPHIQRNVAVSDPAVNYSTEKPHHKKGSLPLTATPVIHHPFLIARHRRDGGGTEGGEHGGPAEIFCDGLMTLSGGEEETRSDYHNLPSFSGRDGLIGRSLARRLSLKKLCEDIKSSQQLLGRHFLSIFSTIGILLSR